MLGSLLRTIVPNVPLVVCLCRSEQGLELDLFLLQCCAALAPADLFVNRIIECFGLSDYHSLSPERSTEYVNFLIAFSLIEKYGV